MTKGIWEDPVLPQNVPRLSYNQLADLDNQLLFLIMVGRTTSAAGMRHVSNVKDVPPLTITSGQSTHKDGKTTM